MNGWSSRTLAHEYGSQFGDEETASTYSAGEFSIEISRPLSFFYWKLLLPLFIVFSASLAALLIRPQDLDVRTALPAGALLTAIFLQKSYSDSLPDLGYLILMDKIYLVAYALIVATLIRAIMAYHATDGANEKRMKEIVALDRRLLALHLLLFAGAVAVFVFLKA